MVVLPRKVLVAQRPASRAHIARLLPWAIEAVIEAAICASAGFATRARASQWIRDGVGRYACLGCCSGAHAAMLTKLGGRLERGSLLGVSPFCCSKRNRVELFVQVSVVTSLEKLSDADDDLHTPAIIRT
jgi:hypothetical protein